MCVFVLSLLKASEDVLRKSMLLMGSRVFLGKAFEVLGDHQLAECENDGGVFLGNEAVFRFILVAFLPGIRFVLQRSL